MTAFVQNVGSLAVQSGSSTTIVIPVTVTTTVGNTVIAWCRRASNASLSSVSDSKGNTWNIDATHLSDTNPAAVVSSVLKTALVNGDTITFTMSTSTTFRSAGAIEVSGLESSGGKTVVDLNEWSHGTGTSISPSAGPSTVAGEFILTYAGSNHGQTLTLTTSDPDSGGTWTNPGIPSASYVAAGYQIPSGTSSFGSTWTVTSGNTVSAGIISYKPAITSHSGTATLSGSGTLSGSAVFAATAGLSGSGTLGGAAGVQVPVEMDGEGTLTAAIVGVQYQFATLSGSGTISVGQGTAIILDDGESPLLDEAGNDILEEGTATPFVTYPIFVQLSGSGTLGPAAINLGLQITLFGSGTLAITGFGGTVQASGGLPSSYAFPGSSQVATAPPGTQDWNYLGTTGIVNALKYSFTFPGGADQMSCTLLIPAGFRPQVLTPGWSVQVTRGGHVVWTGKMLEPVPTAQGWQITAEGDGNRGTDFVAYFTSTWPAGEPDQAVNNAISRGLPWTNPGIGQPPGIWLGQAQDPGSLTITDLLNLVCTRGGLAWYVNSQPGGAAGADLSVFPLPTTVNRLLVITTPVARTLGGDINTIFLRYQTAAPAGTTSATYAVTSVSNQASVAAHGVTEAYIDLSSASVTTAAQAQAVGNFVLSVYQRASYAGPLTASYGQLLNAGGTPIDPGTDQAGTVIRPLLTDFGYGDEDTPQLPVTFITGAYEWDDFAQVATITPFQSLNTSLSGLLSMESTILTPITVSS